MKTVSETEWLESIKAIAKDRRYFAMYSTLWGGVVTDPALMVLPLDEHMVHRGDGIFEAVRVVEKRPYLLRPHLERLHRSADAIALKVPMDMGTLENMCRKLCEFISTPEGILRLFVSRGPGDFSVNPYSTIGNQLYAIAVPFVPPVHAKYERGASLMVSKVPFKPSPYATIKSCNYLFNVMMKKESLDAGYDFCVGLNGAGRLAEGPTENIMLLDSNGCLLAPKFDYTLRGTTLVRVMELAEQLRDRSVKKIRLDDVTVEALGQAREVMMVGTTLGVLPIVKFMDQFIADGKPGPVAKALHESFLRDLRA